LKRSGYSAEKTGKAERPDARRSAASANVALLPSPLDPDEQANSKGDAEPLKNLNMLHDVTIKPPRRRASANN
jgi:hypothetical protein